MHELPAMHGPLAAVRTLPCTHPAHSAHCTTLTCATSAFMSGAFWPSNTNSTFSTGSPKVLVFLHTLLVKLRRGRGRERGGEGGR